ncbi:MAG: S16 family serine protease [Caldivirga sp.]|uniref:S16 family serine protease n=1 Tax=Caldivirga sp. TaxID=2080243 RepID=UPI003D0BD938
MKVNRLLPIIALAIAASALAYSWSTGSIFTNSVTIHALAVSGPSQGAVINITITAVKGLPSYLGGNVYVSAMPLPIGEGGTFISSSQIAAFVATTIAGQSLTSYNFLINVNSSTIEIGGPSASGYMTVGMYSLITNSSLNPSVVMTGMIMPDGTIGPVGGIPDKIRAAAQLGYSTVLIPYGQQNYVSSSGQVINLVNLGKQLGVNVVPVATVYQAIQYFTGHSFNLSLQVTPQVSNNISAISNYLYKTLYVNYGNESALGNQADYEAAISSANNGDYYTAASLLYNALISYYTNMFRNTTLSYAKALVANVSAQLNQMINEINGVKPTTANLDIMVGIYDRIYTAQVMLNTTVNDIQAGNTASLPSDLAQLYVRVITLKYWFNVLNAISGGNPIPVSYLSKLSGLYTSYAYTTVTYLYSLASAEGLTTSIGVINTINQLINQTNEAQAYYQNGLYLEALAVSLDTIASASAIIHTMFLIGGSNASLYLLNIVRNVATYNEALVSQCNGLPVLSSAYVQFGDYWFGQYNSSLAGNPSSVSSQSYFEEALSLYEESIAYSLFLRQLYYELGACPIAYYTVNYTMLQYVPVSSAQHVVQGQLPGASLSIVNLAGVNLTYLAIGVVLVAMSVVVLILKVVKVSRK